MKRLISMQLPLVLFMLAFTSYAQVIPGAVSIDQWRDMWLVQWQSGSPEARSEALIQLSSLLLVLDTDDPATHVIQDKLSSLASQSIDAEISTALHALHTGSTASASQLLLDLVLQHPADHRIHRFRIALARCFRDDGQLDLAAAQLEPVMNGSTPDSLWAKLERARLYRIAGHYDEAMTLYSVLENQNDNATIRRLARDEMHETNFKNLLADQDTSE
ncbi:hypothetical protein JXA80_10375 [bacterium]|nr:hypothetical protein [candidate division CSSED10-310 bacterium]